MAFDALRPHQAQITGLADQGRTLAQIADVLAAQHGVATTPGTLSRFLSSVKGPSRPTPVPAAAPPAAAPVRRSVPELTPAQHAQVDVIALMTELLAEINGGREETRRAIEELAGKIAALSADVVEVEKALARTGGELRQHVTTALANAPVVMPPSIASGPVPGRTLRKIWLRAILIISALWLLLIYAVTNS